MKKLADIYPQIKSGAVISAVDLIRGIGHYAGLEIIKVEVLRGWPTPTMKARRRPRSTLCARTTLSICTLKPATRPDMTVTSR